MSEHHREKERHGHRSAHAGRGPVCDDGCGSFVTAISTSLPVLLVGWSVLEGIGAALILPAIVALVASNFGPAERPRAYGLVASAARVGFSDAVSARRTT